ncbi:FBXL6 family protein [Megaselia abdita]
MTRDIGSGLELIASKWSHSLIELDLAWANVQKPVDNALKALAEKGVECPISHLNLCGSSVSVEAVREVLIKCPNIKSINLSSCRGLPRGVKRLMSGATELQELREAINISDNDK